MDRRPRDIPPEDRYGGGQSYRPGNVRNRSPPPFRGREDDNFNNRSPSRRGEPPFRPRSRSPLSRDNFRRRSPSPRERFGVPRGGDSYRGGRSRTPPRRETELFRRDGDRRDSRDLTDNRRFGNDRGFRDRSPRSLRGDRSPASGRGRGSPAQRRFDARSPPRRFSPRGSDRGLPSRPRSPYTRNDAADGWRRPRSPASNDARQDSNNTSRRSSPPPHASRLALIQDQDGRSSGRPSPRPNYNDRAPQSPQRRLGYGSLRSPTRRADERPVSPRRAFSDRPQSPPRRINYDNRQAQVQPSPAKDTDGDVIMNENRTTILQPQPEEPREPPSGPKEFRLPPSAPRGPSGSGPPPLGPRAESTPSRGGFGMRGRGSYTTDFTGRGRGTVYQDARSNHVPPLSSAPSYEREAPQASVPAGPRGFTASTPARPPLNRGPSSVSQRFDSPELSRQASFSSRPRLPDSSSIPSGPARPSVNSGPHPALRELPEIVTNGRKLPPVVDNTRLLKMQEESERLRRAVAEKEAKKRRSLREWDRLVRESDCAAVRSQVAEDSLSAYELEAESSSVRAAF